MASHGTDVGSSSSRPPSVLASPRPVRSRTQSLSSDRPSTIGLGLTSPPSSVSPEAAFIAHSAASQIVTNDHDSHADKWYDEHGMLPAGDTALISVPALTLVNNFLDQLLFNFLQISRATTLSALRPAVSEVLKPKLAKDAINNADEELREYLGGGDEDDYVQPQGAASPRDWDVELVWKRTRLRCMVYSSLGDMEEEDEDLYMQQENLEIGIDEQVSDVISPAVAIFLTSVLEYMGELTLTVAGQAAYQRVCNKYEKELADGSRDPSDIADRIVVQESDMERVALDRTLGRLWRGWKKRIRGPTIDGFGRSFSPRQSVAHSRQGSASVETGVARSFIGGADADMKSPNSVAASGKDVDPADIPLPMRASDVDEIEVPGLAIHSDDEQTDNEETEPAKSRPKSMFIDPAELTAALLAGQQRRDGRSQQSRARSSSLPTSKKPRLGLGRAAEDIAKGESADFPPADEDPLESPVDTRPEDRDDAEAKVPLPLSAKRLSRLQAATSPRPPRLNMDEVEDVTVYQTAEVITSARISMERTSSASGSEYSTGTGPKRSSSVRSVRIVEVSSPKQQMTFPSPSPLDSSEYMRPPSISGTRSVSPLSEVDEPPKPTILDPMTLPVVPMPISRSPIDRYRPSLQSTETISESEEEADFVPPPRASLPGTAITTSTATSAPSYQQPSAARSRPPQASTPYSARSPQPEHGRPSNDSRSVAPSPAISTHSQFQEGRPDSSASAARVKANGMTGMTGPPPLERQRTRDSEDMALPLQANGSRQTHTSGSATSSATGRHKAVRTSEEINSSRAENVARNFEELIHSNQTITYTLTPEHMRAIDHDGKNNATATRRSEDSRVDRSRSSSTATDSRTGAAGHRGPISPPNEGRPSRSPVTNRAPASPGQRPRGNSNVQAREARVPADSTADFAEFIKATGPPKESPVAPAGINASTGAGKGSVTAARSGVEPPRAAVSSGSNRYQAREASSANARSDTSDLADFLRQGPVASGPVTAARGGPSRGGNTFDYPPRSASSKGFGQSLGTLPEVRHSQASTNATDYSGPSMQSSVNSNSALLKKKPVQPPGNMFDEDDMIPKRKQRRVRDPYAIDLSDEDEDDDDFLVAPKPPAKKEESLAEFLRNYDPPPEPPSDPVSAKVPKKKASAPSLMARFTRSKDKDTAGSVSNSHRSSPSVDVKAPDSRAGSKSHVPIQVAIPQGYNKYGAMDEPIRQAPPRLAPSSSSGRVPMKKFEPREAASSGGSSTNDLAAFLLSSAPPEGSAGPRPPSPVEEESHSSLSRMFGRRKKGIL